jgi:hypothetical protein
MDQYIGSSQTKICRESFTGRGISNTRAWGAKNLGKLEKWNIQAMEEENVNLSSHAEFEAWNVEREWLNGTTWSGQLGLSWLFKGHEQALGFQNK